MATYNVTAQTRRVQFTGDGTAGPFAFSFQVNATSEIKVYVDTTVKTESSHYTVSLNSGTGAGTVSFTSGNHPTSSQTITILGSIPLSRTSVYTSGGQLTSASLESDFDTNMFVHQQTNEEIDRSLRLAEHDVISGADMTLPVKDTRKGTVLGFNATTGNPEAGPNITSVQSLADVTTAINLLGTSAVVEDLGILGTTAIVEDMGFLGTSANVTAMGHLGTSANVTAMGKLGNDATVADMAILGTDAIVADMAILANSTIVDDLAILATSDIVTDMALLATSGNVTAMGVLGTSANVTAMGLLGTSTVVANIATVATGVSGVNSFAERYRVGSSDPSSDNDEGDLFYNTSDNTFKFFNGSSFVAVNVTGIDNVVEDTSPQLGGNLDVQTNSIVSTSNRDIAITPNGSGKVILDGLSHPTSDGSAGQFLKTDGSGNLSFATVSTTTAFDDVTAGDSAVNVTTTSGNITIDAQGSDTDIIFKGTDGSSDITALTLDMSDAGKAIFTGDVQVPSINGSQIAVTNLIINGDMAVNQRGATSGVTSGFFVDRFSLSGCSASAVITSSTPTQFPTAITVSATSGNPIILQKIESKNVQHLSGKVVTASFFAKNVSNATTLFVSLQYAGGADNWSSSTTISEQNLGNLTSDWVKYTASWTVPSGGLNGLQLNILCSGTSTFTMGVTGVQLEEGSVATPFQFKKFADQLRDCQRYYVRAGGANYANIFGVGGIANTTGSWFGLGYVPVPMRTGFTLIQSGGTPRIQNGQAGFNATSVSMSLQATNMTGLSAGCNASGVTLYRWHNMDAGASAALFELDAEL